MRIGNNTRLTKAERQTCQHLDCAFKQVLALTPVLINLNTDAMATTKRKAEEVFSDSDAPKKAKRKNEEEEEYAEESDEENGIGADELDGLDQSQVISGGRRTRGIKIDYSKANFEEFDDEDEEEDDGEVEGAANAEDDEEEEGEEGQNGTKKEDDEEADEEEVDDEE